MNTLMLWANADGPSPSTGPDSRESRPDKASTREKLEYQLQRAAVQAYLDANSTPRLLRAPHREDMVQHLHHQSAMCAQQLNRNPEQLNREWWKEQQAKQ